MSTPKNASAVFMPHGESRRSPTNTNLTFANAEYVHDVDGDESAVIFLNGTGTANYTYVVEGSPDGVNYYALLCYPYGPASVGGTLQLAGQPLYTEAVNAATVTRMLCCAVGGLRKLRVRLSAYTSGNCAVFVNSDACTSINPYVLNQKAATLLVTATGAVSAAVTATLPVVAGLRHYVDWVEVLRSSTAALTAAAAPVIVTSTNLPGALALTFGADAGGVGVDKAVMRDFGSSGLSATAAGTATTIVCPAYTNVIWRVTVAYRLGL